MRSRTNVHYLVFHLTLADTITSYVTLPMETVWRYTIQWHAGNSLCKVKLFANGELQLKISREGKSIEKDCQL